jgi:glycosyltransferase involved in cell wall biosynthesis
VTDPSKSVLFVTDELFLPESNGSSAVYSKVADWYANQGWKVYCLSFYRDAERASVTDVHAAYRRKFTDFLFAPGWNGGGSTIGTLCNALREVSRWASGNVFATNPLLKWCNIQHLQEAVSLIRRYSIGTIYFHKPQTMMLMGPVMQELSSLTKILDLHDDFVERNVMAKAAYQRVVAAIGLSEMASSHYKYCLRNAFSRIDIGKSRLAERSLLNTCNRVLVASSSEFEQYRLRELSCELVHQPWPIRQTDLVIPPPAEPRFDAGFIGSEDVTNLDAVLSFFENILPRIRERCHDFELLIAGRVGNHLPRRLRETRGLTLWPILSDVRRFYDSVRLVVVPLRYGTGVSIKVLEALSFGASIVSTSIGVRGLDCEAIGRVAISDDYDEFASLVAQDVDKRSTYSSRSRGLPLSIVQDCKA